MSGWLGAGVALWPSTPEFTPSVTTVMIAASSTTGATMRGHDRPERRERGRPARTRAGAAAAGSGASSQSRAPSAATLVGSAP